MSAEKNDNQKPDANAIVLNYGDYVVRQSDVDLLVNNQWLNDILIGFYFNYLSDQYGTEKNCMYVGPEVAQLVKMVPVYQVESIIGDLKEEFSTKRFIFIAVNNSDNPNAHSSGSHWSLLFYSRNDDVFFHIDSSNNSNFEDARTIYTKLFMYVSPNSRLENLRGCKRQVNGRDCGLHVICNALKISQVLTKESKERDFATCDAIEAYGMRKNLVPFIQSLASKSK